MSAGKGRDDEVYEAGVRAGQEADVGEQVMHSLTKGYTTNPRENDIYNKGFDYGVAHRPSSTSSSEGAGRNSSGGGESSDSGNAAGGLLAVFVVLVFLGAALDALRDTIAAAVLVAAYIIAIASGVAIVAMVVRGSNRHRDIWIPVCSFSLLLASTFIYNQQQSAAMAAEQQRVTDDQRQRAEEAVRAEQAEQNRLAAQQRVIEGRRIARAVVGTWAGRFETKDAYMLVTKDGGAYHAILSVGYAQIVYHGELVPVKGGGGSTAVLLTPIQRTGDAWDDSKNFDAPFYVAPLQDDSTLVGRGIDQVTGIRKIDMRRVAATDSVILLQADFTERQVSEREFFPTEEVRLYKAPGDFIWESLYPRDIREQRLRVFETGLIDHSHGLEHRHIVVRAPDGSERRAWTRWETR